MVISKARSRFSARLLVEIDQRAEGYKSTSSKVTRCGRQLGHIRPNVSTQQFTLFGGCLLLLGGGFSMR